VSGALDEAARLESPDHEASPLATILWEVRSLKERAALVAQQAASVERLVLGAMAAERSPAQVERRPRRHLMGDNRR
jgi:hypothetical protein